MGNQILHRILAGVVTITLVYAIGSWLLSYMSEGYTKFVFAIILALLIPTLVLPKLFGLRFNTQYRRVSQVFLVTAAIAMVILEALAPPDALLSVYAVVIAIMVALLMTYLIVTYEVDQYLLNEVR